VGGLLTDAYEAKEGPLFASTRQLAHVSCWSRGCGLCGPVPTGRDFSGVTVTRIVPEQFMSLLFPVAYSPNSPSKTVSKNRNISEDAHLQSGLGVFLEKDMLPLGLWGAET